MIKTAEAAFLVLSEMPGQINDSEILDLLYTRELDWKYMDAIKSLTAFSDETISDWFNISVKTLREYRKPGSSFKNNVKEQLLLLLTLIKHGTSVFGSHTAFDNWLRTPNFFFDQKVPASFLNTVTGIRFVNDRLTAMEYGDNV
ncbi:putative toxin-antitoxin system antitoxin component, TIGR02293 family [Cnuella takakiae]|uniref:Putative toxin-antitoxin system antitoxin component, TIGR02293 family n=1 Tax=Cnuella takakiae TaxID=1302690 RepID=A0A1M5I019_9BACT|nr:antitoxin Xre/MbcA/ParS toxin-binding domain-containing protein [Cnuella takakiae]OLY94671.1 hypothetical protein BUE76_05330 [Cnuella takakiae]SHG21656.1 putative toxin-antitoxin system antitoxin component, TIGR02293 family [Cnuella takakiae]